MLKDKDVVATVAVRDLAAARKFYEGTLGLEIASTEGEEAVSYHTGATQLLVYRSQYARTNQATAATWIAGEEIDEVVRELAKRGVAFEHYDFPGMRLEGDVHVMGELRNAWFRDPDGNILSVMNGRPRESFARTR